MPDPTGIARKLTFSPAAGGVSNHCSVSIQVVDAYDNAVAESFVFNLWLSDAVTGLGVAATPPDALTALSSYGHDIGILTAASALVVQTLANGKYILDITDAAGQIFYVAAVIPGGPNAGRTIVSRVLSAADFT